MATEAIIQRKDIDNYVIPYVEFILWHSYRFFFTTFDDLAKSPSAGLHFILRHCGVAITTPNS